MSCININEVSKVLDMNEAIFHPIGCMCETCKSMRQNIGLQDQTHAQGQGQLKFDPWSVQLPHQPNPKPHTSAEWLQLQERHDYWEEQAKECREEINVIIRSRDEWKARTEAAETGLKKLEDALKVSDKLLKCQENDIVYWKNESLSWQKKAQMQKPSDDKIREDRDHWQKMAEKADHWKKSVDYWENESRRLADNAAHWEKMASMHLFRKAKLEEFYELYIKHIDAVKVLDEADDLKCKTAEAVIAYGKELAALDDPEGEEGE